MSFLSDIGSSLSSASKVGADAYKIGKSAAPTVGSLWNTVDSNSYNQYGVPASNQFTEAKDFGKSVGGWNAVGQFGQQM